jgi:hypothetical protein
VHVIGALGRHAEQQAGGDRAEDREEQPSHRPEMVAAACQGDVRIDVTAEWLMLVT